MSHNANDTTRSGYYQPLRLGSKILGRLILFIAFNVAGYAGAQEGNYPSRPIRLIVPFQPGGSTDITARIIADGMAKRFNKAVVVENRGGAGGNIGTEIVARAPPDGYTLLWGNVAPLAINPHLYKSTYESERDFVPLTLATVFPNVLLARPGLEIKSFSELVETARSKHRELNYGSGGIGSSTHLGPAWLSNLLGANWQHIPYRGGAPALLATAAGEIDLSMNSVPAALQFIAAGSMKALATTGKFRDPLLPDVPTVAESGFPDFEVVNWNGLLAPKGTPDAICDFLDQTVFELLASPEIKAQLTKVGATPSPSSRHEFADFIKAESRKWSTLLAALKVKLD